MSITFVDQVTTAVDTVNHLLPFPTDVIVDMGDVWVPVIYFGPIDLASGLRAHRAGIDPDDAAPTWWADFNGGDRVEISTHTITSDPANVAAWITRHADRNGY